MLSELFDAPARTIRDAVIGPEKRPTGRPRRCSPTEIERIKQRRADGRSYNQLADEFGTSYGVIQRVITQF